MPEDIKIWRYQIPGEDGHCFGWGIFLLDSTGMFAAVTDYGNYASRWTHTGRDDFREFVIRDLAKSPGYLLGKVAKRVHDGEATLNGVKEYILECRRDGEWSKEEAREEWDLLAECDGLDSIPACTRWYDSTKISDPGEFMSESYDTDAWAFAKVLMPRLAEVLKQELEIAEGAA
jgi:hypothetical protein